jgi:hypothetical protein
MSAETPEGLVILGDVDAPTCEDGTCALPGDASADASSA